MAETGGPEPGSTDPLSPLSSSGEEVRQRVVGHCPLLSARGAWWPGRECKGVQDNSSVVSFGHFLSRTVEFRGSVWGEASGKNLDIQEESRNQILPCHLRFR
jgi:hypothetical protein